MKINAESYGHAVMLNLNGDLTADALEAFKQAVDHQLQPKEVVDLVLNCESVPFIDSAALECLLDIQEKLAERFGQIKLVKCDESVRKILEITALQSTFEHYDRVADAVKALSA